jgi:hypothetical protein
MLLDPPIDLPEAPVALLQRPREGDAGGGAGRAAAADEGAAGEGERELEVTPAAARTVTGADPAQAVSLVCDRSRLWPGRSRETPVEHREIHVG